MLPIVKDLSVADYVTGCLILIDKPQGWTSFDVVNKVRGLIRHKYNLKKIKVGHSGTLDPMATGLLLICTGSWTKELHHLTGLDKKYTGLITLGIETDSYDAEGKVTKTRVVPTLSADAINTYLQPFFGEFEQYPPIFSAIKKDGKHVFLIKGDDNDTAKAPPDLFPDQTEMDNDLHAVDVAITEFMTEL